MPPRTFGNSVYTKPCADRRGGWLHQWLLGEYLAMLLMAHAIMTAIVWVAYAENPPRKLVMVLACGWVATRSAGGFSGSRFVSVVTIIVWGLTWATWWAEWAKWETIPAWLVAGPFSQSVLQASLAAVLVIDLLELCWSRRLRDDPFDQSVGRLHQREN